MQLTLKRVLNTFSLTIILAIYNTIVIAEEANHKLKPNMISTQQLEEINSENIANSDLNNDSLVTPNSTSHDNHTEASEAAQEWSRKIESLLDE